MGVRNVSLPNIVTHFDLHNQRVIKADVLRTKSGVFTDKEMNLLETLLTYYCKDTKTSYKQGINEIFAPFLLMMRNGISLEEAYVMGKHFIENCLLTMFKDDVIVIQTFRPAQAMFHIIRILLKYINPLLAVYLEPLFVTPELYATSWVVTLFATKIPKLENVFYMWREILMEKDPIFSCYLAVSLLEHYQIQIEDKKCLNAAEAISKIRIQTFWDLKSIVECAKTFKRSLPFSWRYQVMNFDIFNLQTIDSVIKDLHKKKCMSLLAREIIPKLYPGLKCTCQDLCVWCDDKNFFKKPMIFVDCRTELEQQSGVIPNTEVIDESLWANPMAIERYVNRFFHIRNTSHIVLIGSSNINPSLTTNKNKVPKASYEMVEFLYDILVEKGFSYVSILEGGFSVFHQLLLRFNIEIKNHIPEYCFVCNPDACKPVNKTTARLKKITKSMSEVLKTTVTKVVSGFSFNMGTVKDVEEVIEYADAIAYLCRRFDKITQGPSDEEYSLLILKTEVVLGRYVNNNPKKIVKVLEAFPVCDLLKITSMKKFPNVLTFFTTNKQLCLILEDSKKAKDCTGNVTKYFRELKSKK